MEEKISYKPKSFRLDEETLSLLGIVRGKLNRYGEKRGDSWNLIIKGMAKAEINSGKQNYYEYFEYRKHRKDSCEGCGATDKLCVHHVDNDITNNNASNLKTYCRKCHGRYWEHDNVRRSL